MQREAAHAVGVGGREEGAGREGDYGGGGEDVDESVGGRGGGGGEGGEGVVGAGGVGGLRGR